MRFRSKQRSLTTEMLLYILVLAAIPLGVLSYYFFLNITTGLQNIEKEKALQINQSTQLMIERVGGTLLGIAISNGSWEDNRQAVLQEDEAWIDDNVNIIADVVPYIDFIAETDLSGKVISQTGDAAEFTGQLAYPVIMERFREKGSFTGIVSTSLGLAIIGAAPITDDSATAPPAGLLIFGRLLDSSTLDDLRDSLHTEIAISLASGQFISTTGRLEEMDPQSLQLKNNDIRFETFEGPDHTMSKVSAPFTDMDGETIGVLHTEIPSVSLYTTSRELKSLSIVSGVIMLFLLILVTILLRLRVILPLRHFRHIVEQVASGKAIDGIPRHVLQAEAEIVQAIVQIRDLNRVLEEKVAHRTQAIRNLLDHAGQGFLTIKADLFVQEEYSQECLRILGCYPAGIPLPKLLYQDDPEEQRFLGDVLESYWAETDSLRKEAFLSLLPADITINEIPVHVSYQEIPGTAAESDSLMLILSDKSEERRLETQMSREQQVLRMVVKSTAYSEDFAELLAEYKRFTREDLNRILMIPNVPVQWKLGTICQHIHTFKGSFALFQMKDTVARLHELESELTEKLKQAEELSPGDTADWLQSLALPALVESDLELIRQALGSKVLDRMLEGQISFQRSDWIQLEKRIADRLDPLQDQGLLQDLKQWRYKPLGELLSPYDEYTRELAARNGKLVNPLQIVGGQLRVDSQQLQPFIKALGHVVRNAVVHGIEAPDERLNRSKDPYGTIKFVVAQENDSLRIEIGDDGAGIPLERLKQAVAEKKLLSSDQARELSKEDAIAFLFHREISTSDELTEWAGRGVGLSAVRDITEGLGGAVQIDWIEGRGTTVVFLLPLSGSVLQGEEGTHATNAV